MYCEKPPAIDAEAARSVVEAERKSTGIFMVGFNQRFNMWAQYVKAKIDSGELGRIYHAQTQWHRRDWTGSFGTWFTDKSKAGGGHLIYPNKAPSHALSLGPCRAALHTQPACPQVT